jgi:hypothetical protein
VCLDTSGFIIAVIDRLVETKTAYNLLIGRVSQHQSSAADQDRQVCNRDAETIQKFLNVGVTFQINVRVGLLITSQKLLNAECVEGMTRTNQNKITNPTSASCAGVRAGKMLSGTVPGSGGVVGSLLIIDLV